MTTSPPNRRWIWFFAVLALLAIAGLTIPIVYNLRQQLKREAVEAALERWKEKGPHNYDLRYVVKRLNQEPERYRSEIRNGRVVAAWLNDRPLPPQARRYHDMEHRFADILGFLNEDAKPGKPRVFVTAQFDAHDGRLLHYVRSVTGTRERVEINVELVRGEW